MNRHKGGMALTYTIGFIVVLVLFMGSIYVRTLHTIRFTQYDANLIKAKQVSEAGLLFSILTMRDIDPFFYEKAPFSEQGDSWVLDGLENQDFFADTPFAESELDGHFQLKIYDTSQYVTPETGTFLTIESRGKVRNRVATSKMTVKLTNPFLNYLIVARDELRIDFETLAPRIIRGPVLVVDDNPSDGKGGDVIFSHMTQFGNPTSYRVQKGGVIMNGDITTTGQIRIDNQDEANRPRSGTFSGYSYDGGGLSLQGFDDLDGDGVTEAISNVFHIRDFDIAATFGPPELTTYGGEIEFQDVSVLDDVPVRPGIHTMDAVLDSIKRLKDEPHVQNVDIGSFGPGGVLVEFAGGQVFVSEALTQDSGYFFTDADFWVDPDYRYLMEYRLGVARSVPVGGSREKTDVRNEVIWDDPAFRNADPSGWPNTSSFPAGVVVDAFDITHVARGRLISSFSLQNDDWTIVRLLTNSIDVEGARHTSTVAPDGTVGSPTVDPGSHGPPVYVRGIVDGKVVLVYDVADGRDKSERSDLHIGILGQHELDTDPPLGAGKIPGGLLYSNRQVKTSEDDIGREGFTDDMAVIVCGGSVGPVGDSGYAFRRVRRKSDNTVQNLRQIYDQRDQQMIAAYSTGDDDDDNFKIVSWMYHQLKDHVKVPFYGVAIAGQTGRHHPRYDVENGRLFPAIHKAPDLLDNFPAAYYEAENEFADRPAGHAATDENPLGTFMRWTRGAEGGAVRLFGSFHGLSGNPGLKGEQTFDYRLQELKAKDIYLGMGLPVTTILADWERP